LLGLPDACQDARVKNLLCLVAVDIAIEAAMVRRQWKEHDLAELMADEGRSRRVEGYCKHAPAV
jgi:hypothetical protein